MQALSEDSDEYDGDEACTDTSGNADDNQDAQREGEFHDASDDDFTRDNDCASNGDYNSNSSDDCASNGDYNSNSSNQDAQREGEYHDASDDDDFASDDDCASNGDYNSNSSETDQHRRRRPDSRRSSVNARLELQSPAQEEMAKQVTIMMVRVAMWGAILQRRHSEQEWDQKWCEKWNAAWDMSTMFLREQRRL